MRAQSIITTGISIARIRAAFIQKGSAATGPDNDDRLRGRIEASGFLRRVKVLVNSLLIIPSCRRLPEGLLREAVETGDLVNLRTVAVLHPLAQG